VTEIKTPEAATTVAHQAATSPPGPKYEKISWKSLDNFSHIQFLKISYVVLVLIPFLALVQHEAERWLPEKLRHMPLIFALLYFSSLLLSLAHMVYQGWCPVIIKRFDSPNDLYRELLKIKALQALFLSEDTNFTFHIEHCRKRFNEYNFEAPHGRLACAICYYSGGGLFLVVVALQALRLFGVFWGL
jgi:hypothetical protein